MFNKDMSTQELEDKIKEVANKFTEDNINNPGDSEYLLIHNAILTGWELGVKQAIEYMKKNGIKLGD